MAPSNKRADIPFPFLVVAVALIVLLAALAVQEVFDLETWFVPVLAVAAFFAVLLAAWVRNMTREGTGRGR